MCVGAWSGQFGIYKYNILVVVGVRRTAVFVGGGVWGRRRGKWEGEGKRKGRAWSSGGKEEARNKKKDIIGIKNASKYDEWYNCNNFIIILERKLYVRCNLWNTRKQCVTVVKLEGILGNLGGYVHLDYTTKINLFNSFNYLLLLEIFFFKKKSDPWYFCHKES